jgi:DNA-binding GntR family transcriptional regulator
VNPKAGAAALGEQGRRHVTTADQTLAPAARRVLADEVADAIREAIFSGRIELGQRLIEEDLATMLSVSRGPVREALALLTQEGLTKIERHRGTTVAPLSVGELHEIYSLRSALESLAADWVCRNATDEDFAKIGAVLDGFDALASPPTRPAVAALDMEFHDAIFLAAHHERLYRAWGGIRSQIFLYLVNRGALRVDFALTWRGDHDELLQVLRQRKRVAARKFVELHIRGSYGRALAASGAQKWQADERDIKDRHNVTASNWLRNRERAYEY